MSRTSTYEIKCARCPHSVAVIVRSTIFHDETKRCAERTAEIHGFTLGREGPVCLVHREQP